MLVFTHGLVVSPFSTAFLASRPAPIITDGLEVLVQLVMAPITTAPSNRLKVSFPSVTATVGLIARAGEAPPSPAHRDPLSSPTARFEPLGIRSFTSASNVDF